MTGSADVEQVQSTLRKRSALALAAIDNADRITWSVQAGGRTLKGGLDRAEAGKLLGRSLDSPSSPEQLEQDVAHVGA